MSKPRAKIHRPLWAARLALIRQWSGLSQTAFGATIGVTKEAYQLYEKGLREPRFDTLRRINATYKVSLDVLLSDIKGAGTIGGAEFDLGGAPEEERMKYFEAVAKATAPPPAGAQPKSRQPTPQPAPLHARPRSR